MFASQVNHVMHCDLSGRKEGTTGSLWLVQAEVVTYGIWER